MLKVSLAPVLQGTITLVVARSSTTYQQKWNSGETCVVRVPKALSGSVLEYARALDEGDRKVEEMGAPLVLERTVSRPKLDRSKPINVSSVPQRSPFRYPGGKTWLVPIIRKWLAGVEGKPDVFVEPFAGGAIASLTVAFEQLANHVVFSEIEEGVASVWQTILTGQAGWLASVIQSFPMTEANVRAQLGRELSDLSLSVKEKAFITILRNRVQRGGIMAPGAGLVRNGENGKGLSSRWYPSTLARRIQEIASHKALLTFLPLDAFKLVEQYQSDPKAAFFVDPPYTVAAKRLYQNWKVDHERLFELMSRCRGSFLMTYDDTEEVRELAERFGFEVEGVAMKSTHHIKKTELLISKELDWLHS